MKNSFGILLLLLVALTSRASSTNATFTATPRVKATNGLSPAALSSRNRVVSPMLRKLTVNTHTRSVLIGATSFGFATAL